ncbi:hypothetical protein Bint_2727 [Brachyspira intermedia PWS/A]|uniref:TPR domain-containing protein n=1 Tax=Brachyspira intermedia (strain ATCC 51140 / PWS/A) TaxID=1045858 RepID=G0EQ63_BRAIP|nr:hypothetical protein [Brachyspira intermedia]AEM23321.1 hypothetical protein Bint_2727 [Brachyspira intermedia PWS/A]
MSDNTNNLNNRNNTTFILYIVVCSIFLIALIIIYLLFSSSIKKSMDYSIGKFETNSQIQLSNYYEFLKEMVTNESFENKEFIKNTLEEAFKPNIDLLRETLKDSKDFSINTVTFWLAFLSLIMIIFTILGIYANNKIMESNQKQSELIIKDLESKAENSFNNIGELVKENKEYIENLKSDFDNIKNSLLSEMETIKDDAIKTKDNTLNEVNSIKKEIDSNKKESEDLKSEIYEIRDESKKLLKEMREERKAQSEEGKNIIEKIKIEGNTQKEEAKDLKSEIERIKEEAEKMLKEMKEEREVQKEESEQTLEELNKKAKEIESTLKKIEKQTKQSKINADRAKVSELFNRALRENDKNNKEKAIKLYTEIINEYNSNDTDSLNNRGVLYSDKYKETKDEEYFDKALEDYNHILRIDNNDYGTYINMSFLYLNHYEINKENKESLTQAEKYLNEGLKLYTNDLELINNYGILLYFKYKEDKKTVDLNNSEMYFNKSIGNTRTKENIGETYYYLHLVYDEYAKLDENISGYSKEECEKKSKEYLQKSKDLGYKHFMDK